MDLRSVGTLVGLLWRAAAPGLKPFRLPRARSPGTGEGRDWWSWLMGVKVEGTPGLDRVNKVTSASLGYHYQFSIRNSTLKATHTKKVMHYLSQAAPTQSMIYVPLLVCVFHKSIWLVFQYKYFKSCSKDFKLQNLILRTRLCGTGFIPQHCWVVDFQVTKMVRRKCLVPGLYQLRKGISTGLVLK